VRQLRASERHSQAVPSGFEPSDRKDSTDTETRLVERAAAVAVSRLTNLESAAQTGFWLGQQTALHTERITNIGSTDPTVGDQDLAQELPGLLLLLECVAELRLRDQAHLDQNLTQQTPRLFSRAWRPTGCFSHNPMVSLAAEVSLKSHGPSAVLLRGTAASSPKPNPPLLTKWDGSCGRPALPLAGRGVGTAAPRHYFLLRGNRGKRGAPSVSAPRFILTRPG
jgi:hypothetical protein